jgi:hypothetical protein
LIQSKDLFYWLQNSKSIRPKDFYILVVGHMTEVCAVVNDGDKTRKDTLVANTTITGSQDVDNVSTAGE